MAALDRPAGGELSHSSAMRLNYGATFSMAITALVACPMMASAQGAREYGSKPIRVIVPVPAGGGTDIIARVITSGLADSGGLKMIIDNRPTGSVLSDEFGKLIPSLGMKAAH